MVLCRVEAGGARSSYPLNEKHALIAMLAAAEEELPRAVETLLESNGWLWPSIQEATQLHEPFGSDDADITQWYVAAQDGRGGVIVYADAQKGDLANGCNDKLKWERICSGSQAEQLKADRSCAVNRVRDGWGFLLYDLPVVGVDDDERQGPVFQVLLVGKVLIAGDH